MLSKKWSKIIRLYAPRHWKRHGKDKFHSNFTEQYTYSHCFTFSRMRELENECHEKVSETIMLAFERFAKTDMDELDDTIREVGLVVLRVCLKQIDSCWQIKML